MVADDDGGGFLDWQYEGIVESNQTSSSRNRCREMPSEFRQLTGVGSHSRHIQPSGRDDGDKINGGD